MAFLFGVQNDYKETNTTINDTTNDLSLSTDFTDASIRDTLINNYITDIVNRNEDVQELTKNFENNVKSESESVQRNDLNLNGCIDMSGMELAQVNELIQAVAQGFEMLYDDIKTLKRASSIDTNTQGSGDITTDSAQSVAMQTDQATTAATDASQAATQASKQKQSFVHKYASGGGLRESYYASRRAGSAAVKSIGKFFGKLVGSNQKKETYVEHFMNYYYKPRKEGFFPLFTKLSVQNSREKINENTNITKNISKYDYKTNIQTQDIYKKIESVYNKCNEVINKIKEDQSIINNSVARAQSIQENKLAITNQSDICALKLNNAKLTQSNKLNQSVQLKNIVKNINALGSDNESKAIMADMFGLTNKSTAAQSADMASKQTSDITSKTSQSASQVTDQTSEMSLLGGLGNLIAIFVVIALIGAVAGMFKGASKQVDPFFDAVGIKRSSTEDDDYVEKRSRADDSNRSEISNIVY